MTRLTDVEDPRPTDVYRLFDKSGNLLYVGVSSCFPARLDHHRSAFINPWAHLVDHWTTETYPDRATARDVERELIETLAPRFNRNHQRRRPLDVSPRGRDGEQIEDDRPGRDELLAALAAIATPKSPACAPPGAGGT